MKKFIIIFTVLMLASPCTPASQYGTILDNLENSLYGFTYTTSDDASRLSRIEESVYGQSRANKPINERISSLKKDMSADLIGQEISPKEDTFAEDEYKYNDKLAQEKLPPPGANVDYPSVNALEKQVFNQEFKTQDLNSRLANLEKKTLGKTFETDAFSSRVERLQAKIQPEELMENKLANASDDFYEDTTIPLDKTYKLDEYQPQGFDYDTYNKHDNKPEKINLASVEKSIFKHSFNNENMNNRLARLESTMFGTTFDTDTQEDRLRRISSAYKAQKTANKYDSNKFSQNMATAMQIGTILLMILACVL